MARKKAKKSAGKAKTETPGEKIFGVSEITRLIKNRLETEFPAIWVEGELGRVTDHPSGHMYMTLKEEKDVLDVTIWRASRKLLKFDPETGMKVITRGRISVYGPFGKYQLIADKMEPSGIGALQIRFEQLKKKLDVKGYFSEERKRPIPAFPQTVGVITSSSGAAFRDIARILRRRDPGIRIILAPVLVEGAGAAPQIAEAIGDFNRYKKVDVIIAGRGGGSPESLWAFNEEVVADAIFKSKIPVISAVGHEIDFTIADLVADLRASTPSAAAELAVRNRADLVNTVGSLFTRLAGAVLSYMKILKGDVRELARRPVLSDPARFFENDQRLVDDLGLRIENAVRRNRLEILNRIGSLARHLGVLKPSMQLRRQGDNVKNLTGRLEHSSKAMLTQKKALYKTATSRLVSASPAREIRRKGEGLSNSRQLLERSWATGILGKRRHLEKLEEKLGALSPRGILSRGYSIARTAQGGVIRDESQVSVGDTIKVELFRGEIDSRVTAKKRPPRREKS